MDALAFAIDAGFLNGCAGTRWWCTLRTERRWLPDWGRGRLLGSGGGSGLGQARQVAGGQMAGGGGLEQGLLGAAAVEGIGTAGVEAAARGRIDRARHVALEDDALA